MSLETMPSELIAQVSGHLGDQDLCNMRMVSKALGRAVVPSFLAMLARGNRLHPHYQRMKRFLMMLRAFPRVKPLIKELTVVCETVRTYVNGNDLAWETLLLQNGARETPDDREILDEINRIHTADIAKQSCFLHNRLFTSLLIDAFTNCPNLEYIHVRTLNPGEHIPDWIDLNTFKQLSFWRPGMDFSKVLYGNYMYDADLRCTTLYEDSYGEIVGNFSKQNTFIQDLAAALAFSGTKATCGYIYPIDPTDTITETAHTVFYLDFRDSIPGEEFSRIGPVIHLPDLYLRMISLVE